MSTVYSAAFLRQMQEKPTSLLRGSRRPMFVPLKTSEEPKAVLFISTASDLSWWPVIWAQYLQTGKVPRHVQLQRPGSMTYEEVMTLRRSATEDLVLFDVWAGDEATRSEMFEALLPYLPSPSKLIQ